MDYNRWWSSTNVNKNKMIKEILNILKADDFIIGDEVIDIAKGKYEAPLKLKEIKNYIKRNR
jgi:ribosomal protein S8